MLFPNEDILTKEIESWKGFADTLPAEEDRKIFTKMLNDCYKYAKAISAIAQPFPSELLCGSYFNWDIWNTALTIVLQWIGQRYKRNWNVLSVIWNTSIILGNSHDKTVGKAMVLLWFWRNDSVDYLVGYDTGSKSDFKRKRITNKFYEYRHRAV